MPAALTSADLSGARDARARRPPRHLLLGPLPVVVIGAEGVGSILFHADKLQSALALAIGLGVAIAALLMRQRQPVTAIAIVLIDAAVVNFAPTLTLPMLLALFTIAMLRPRRETWIAALATAVVTIATPALHGHPITELQAILSRLVGIGMVVAIGLYLRTRQDYIEGLHERAERLERERELLSQQAVTDERGRIARELHDAVAHSVSLMVVQTQALRASGVDPQAAPTLDRIAGLGREALSEMHRMLGVLRPQQDGAERAPQPGVEDIAALVAQVREAGLEAGLRVEGDRRALPAGVDLSAYRIVQEALTNVIRHAHAANAIVTVRYGSDALELQVVDDGVGPQAPGDNGNGSGGHGLLGMRERVALFDGELELGAGPSGGYRVRAVLPLS